MQEGRSLRDYIALSGKGMMMGAADAVPGVSGGTIAFMTGIYEELIYSLKQCGPSALIMLFKEGPVAAWKHVNGTFLLTLISGILFSLLTISHVVLYWLAEYPELLWSFFFGLILASVWSVCRHVEHWDRNTYTSFIIGVITAYFITSMSPTSVEATPLFIFLSGMVAICAMILPGISGSFILLLLGMYTPILMAIKNIELFTLSLFATGCVVGLLSFSRVLSWMFSSFRTATLALLGGFMLGSLNKVWPWKYTTAYTINRHGQEVPLVQENISPFTFESLTGEPALLVYAFGLMLLGALMVVAIEKMGRKSGV
jgi:putative membrane protein